MGCTKTGSRPDLAGQAVVTIPAYEHDLEWKRVRYGNKRRYDNESPGRGRSWASVCTLTGCPKYLLLWDFFDGLSAGRISLFPPCFCPKQGFLTCSISILGIKAGKWRGLPWCWGGCEPPGRPGRVGSTDSPSPTVGQISTCWADVNYPPPFLSLGLRGVGKAVCFVDAHGEPEEM